MWHIICRNKLARHWAWVRPFMGFGIGCKKQNFLKTEKDFGRLNTISLCSRHVLLLSHGRVGYVHGSRVCDVRSGYGSREEYIGDPDEERSLVFDRMHYVYGDRI